MASRLTLAKRLFRSLIQGARGADLLLIQPCATRDAVRGFDGTRKVRLVKDARL